jgi:hypothetical protein
MMCGEAGSAVALLQVPGTRVTCNTVTISEFFSVECPIKKTDIPAGPFTLEFSMIPITTGGSHIGFGLPGPAPFVVLGNPTTTVTSTACTPAAIAPSACNPNNCLRALQHTPAPASSFCSFYLAAKATSTSSFISHGCEASLRISSACKCLTAENTKRTLIREVKKPRLEEYDLEERVVGYSGPDGTLSCSAGGSYDSNDPYDPGVANLWPNSCLGTISGQNYIDFWLHI